MKSELKEMILEIAKFELEGDMLINFDNDIKKRTLEYGTDFDSEHPEFVMGFAYPLQIIRQTL